MQTKLSIFRISIIVDCKNPGKQEQLQLHKKKLVKDLRCTISLGSVSGLDKHIHPIHVLVEGADDRQSVVMETASI